MERSLEEIELDLNDINSKLCIVDFSQSRIATPESDVADFVTYPGLGLGYRNQFEALVDRYLNEKASLEHKLLSKDDFQVYTEGLRLASFSRAIGGANHNKSQIVPYLKKANEVLREDSRLVNLRSLLGEKLGEMKNGE